MSPIMKTNSSLRIQFIMFLSVFLAGCSAANTTLQNSNPEKKSAPVEQNQNRVSDNRIIKAEGWQIPSPEKKEQVRKKTKSLNSDEGDAFEVTLTYYVPTERFIYREKPLNDNQIILVKGELELFDFIEYRVKDKIFAYTIFARRYKIDQPNDNSSHEHKFVYRILDSNGDGKFETLLTDNSELLVPQWILKTDEPKTH
jgi:hypothetical protein